MQPLSKNRWLNPFLDMVKMDLSEVDWTQMGTDNLTHVERRALKELRETNNLVIKRSDKGGNVLMNKHAYEKEAKCLLNDHLTYKRLDYNIFPEVVRQLNWKLSEAKETGLLTTREHFQVS